MNPKIKLAFQKVKEDIEFLKKELFFLNMKVSEISKKLSNFALNNKTDNSLFSTDKENFKTDNLPFKPLKTQILRISTGNQGVSTDRQTDRQTDRHIPEKSLSLDNAIKILNSLDSVKKEIRLKFKKLTDQEFLVFTTIYQISEEHGFSSYKTLSNKLNLSESVVRDYVGRIIKKGVPIKKTKINNKTVHLSIPQDFKNTISLSTLLKLREI